jgi:DNA-directed RNA polymerase alpha subunit
MRITIEADSIDELKKVLSDLIETTDSVIQDDFELENDVNVDDLGLTAVPIHGLKRAGINTLSQLKTKSKADLLESLNDNPRRPSWVKKNVAEILSVLELRGIRLREK